MLSIVNRDASESTELEESTESLQSQEIVARDAESIDRIAAITLRYEALMVDIDRLDRELQQLLAQALPADNSNATSVLALPAQPNSFSQSS